MGARENVHAALNWLVEVRFSGNQTAFAKSVGVTRQKANNWITGFCAPDLEMVGVIARTHNLSLDWLIGGDTSKAPADYIGD